MDIKLEEIIYVLTRYKELIRRNLEMKKALYEEMDWEIADKELIEALALKGRGAGTISSGGDTRGLDDLVIRKKDKKKAYMRELQKRIEFLDGEWEVIQRVWVCLQALPVDQYNILKMMYLEKEKWNVIERQLAISHGSLVKKRKEALIHIQKMYNSSFSNLQLAEGRAYESMKPEEKHRIR